MSERFDVAVVGSGPSGALAASRLVEGGARVLMLDVSNDDERGRRLVPDRSFSELRHTDADQKRYFLGERLEGVPVGGVRVGAQLTPPRQFVTRDVERHLPIRGEGFEPMQSLALGGLGAAWGAASFTYTAAELRRIGIVEPGFSRHYDEVARLIGVSGDPGDDASEHCFAGIERHQPPLELSSLAQCVWQAYAARRTSLLRRGFSLGRTPLAVLSRDLGERHANPYFDMDFWGDSRRSVFRPRYLVEELEKRGNFRLERGQLVLAFESDGEGVRVACRQLASGERADFRARRLLLCAGAINSARIALGSLERADVCVPMLCNPYLYAPCISVRMLGREAGDRCHSLSQLVAIHVPEGAPDDAVSAQLYSYRSLLLFKLVKELPLPPWAGLAIVRYVVNSIAIVGIHHSDAPHAGKTLRIVPRAEGELPEVRIDFRPSDAEIASRRRRENAMLRHLLRLGVVPFAKISPGHASSIHYAGTLPIREAPGVPFACRPDGRLWAAPNVYVGDSSGWCFLPAKGPTLTIMANARRVAEHVLRDLGAHL